MKKFFSIGIVLILIVGVGAVLFLGRSTTSTSSNSSPTKVTGSVYLTLSTPAGGLQILTFDPNTKTLHAFPESSSLFDAVSPSFSQDGARIAFAGRATEQGPYQIYIENADGTNLKQLTDTARLYKREPAWNNDGSVIAYTIQRENASLDFLVPQSWAVYVTDMNGKTMFVTQGVDPFFSPDGKQLFVLMNDGLHAFDMAPITDALAKPIGANSPTFASTVVIPISGGAASQTMKIAISPDASMLSWSSVLQHVVRLYDITSWTPLTLALKKEIPVYAYWTVFSPDNASLALQEVSWDMGPKNPQLVIMHLADGSMTTEASLSSYSLGYMWMTAWR